MLLFSDIFLSLQILSIMSTAVVYFVIMVMSAIRRRVAWLLLFILILLWFCFTVFLIVFTFVVTNKGAGRVVSGRGYKEYRLGDYSNWLQKRVEKSSNWIEIKSRLQDAEECKSLTYGSINEAPEEFYKNYLSPTEFGCCKPPTSCNFLYVNVTYWISTAGNSTDMDCSRWNNDEDRLCYSCNSCKAGVLVDLKYKCRMFAVFNIVEFIFLVLPILCAKLRNGYKGYLSARGSAKVGYSYCDS